MSEFDDTNQFEEGADPTEQAGSFASLLLQMVRQLKPATLYGVIIESSDTPPTDGDDAWRKRALWFKPDHVREDGGNGAYFRWDETAGSWENLEDYLNAYGEVSDGAVNLDKLDPTIGAALQLIRKNAGNNAWEFVNPGDIISDGSIAITKLAARTATPKLDYFLLTDSSGVWTETSWATKFAATLFLSQLFTSQLEDDLGGSENQVLYKGDADNFLIGYIEDLLRVNTLLTNRIKWPTGGALKLLQLNGSSTDVQVYDPSGLINKVAVLSEQQAANTDGTTYPSNATPHTLVLNTEHDPDTFVTLAANVFTLSNGTYLIDVRVPVNTNDVAEVAVRLELYSTVGASLIFHRSFSVFTSRIEEISLQFPVEVTGSGDNAFSIRMRVNGNVQVGKALNLDSLAEIYTQVTITKHS